MKRVYATLTALTLIAGCRDSPVGIEAKTTAAFTKAPITPQEVATDLVARGFSLAMKDAAVRNAIRDAMRASPLTEHKLRFQDFVRTAGGEMLLSVGARRLGMTLPQLQEIVAQLPPLDFYLPGRSQRRSWRGEAAVRVGYILDHDARNARAFDANGAVVGLLDPGSNATFVLQLAERSSRRINSQRMIPTSVIEDADDGTLSGSVVDYLPDGTTKVTDLADLYVETPVSIPGNPLLLSVPAGLATFRAVISPKYIILCDEPGGEPCSGGGGAAPPDTTFLQDVQTWASYDGWSYLEDSEFEWHTYFSTNSGTTWTDRRDVRLEGVHSSGSLQVHIPALFKKLRSSTQRIQSDVVETDTFIDDHFPPSPQWTVLDNNKMKFEGPSRCGTILYDAGDAPRQPDYLIVCETTSWFGEATQYYDWKEVNQSMFWNP